MTLRLKMGVRHQAIALIGIIVVISGCQGSIYPDGEDKAAWDARINAKIDTLHKRDVNIEVDLSADELAKAQVGKLRLRVNQTRTPIPFGKFQIPR